MQIKQKQRKLEAELGEATGKHARQRIEHEIQVLKQQRSKGVALYQEL